MVDPAGRRISSGCSTYSGLLLEHIQHPNPPTQKATMAMITMYQIWARPQPTDTETRWIKIGQIATGYTFRKACDVAARHDNSFPEDKIAILPVENVPRAKPHEPPWCSSPWWPAPPRKGWCAGGRDAQGC